MSKFLGPSDVVLTPSPACDPHHIAKSLLNETLGYMHAQRPPRQRLRANRYMTHNAS